MRVCQPVVVCLVLLVPAASTGQRVHLSEVARRITATNWCCFSGELADLTCSMTQGRRRATLAGLTSRFDRRLFRRYGQIMSPATARRVRSFPWTAPMKEAHPYLDGRKRVDNSPSHVVGREYLRGVMVNSVAKLADSGGWVQLEKLKPTATTSAVSRALWWSVTKGYKEHTQRMGMDPNPDWGELLQYATRPTARKMLTLERSRLVPTDMQALKWVRREYDPRGALSGMRVWAHQHLVGNTMGMLEAMGLTPRKTTLFGKVYSLDPRVGWALRLSGFSVVGNSIPRSRARIEAEVRRELSRISSPEKIHKPRFLLLDDGGELIEVVANYVRQNFPRHAHLFAAVEQTTHGITRLNKVRLPFVVVGSARSWAKRTYAAPMHGYAIVKYSLPRARRLARTFPSEFTNLATVMGYGAIGKEVARQLRRAGYDVQVCDIDPAKTRQALADTEPGRPRYRVTRSRAQALARTGILFSCVGKPIHCAQRLAHEVAGNTQIVNGASWDEIMDESGKPLFVAARGRYPSPELNDLQFVHNGRTAIFHRSGGVTNFPRARFGKSNADMPIPGRYIQLDLGLLYLAMLQASHGGPKRITDLPFKPQKRLVGVIERQLGRRGESLLDPRW
jgi:S-adenosylhomocysteine hydrolase